MGNQQKALLHISSICWNDVNNPDLVTNVKDLTTTEYVTVSKEAYEKEDYKEINKELKDLTTIDPWYYNVDFVCWV